jgi:hypothetical protein
VAWPAAGLSRVARAGARGGAAQVLMAGWLPTTRGGSWGLPSQAWLIGQNPEEAPSWASVAHAGHPGLGHQLALITLSRQLDRLALQILLKLQRLIDLLHPGHAALDGRQHLLL